MQSCVLFQNIDRSIVLLDIPRSIELSQSPPGQPPDRFLAQTRVPPREPYDIISGKEWGPSLPSSSALSELMTAESCRVALEEISGQYKGPWFLERKSVAQECLSVDESDSSPLLFPEEAQYISGSIEETRPQFIETAPQFNLVIMDPPWPNRSAKRITNRYRYATLGGLTHTRSLLESLPVSEKLAPGGIVAVWVTNSPGAYELLTGQKGVFAYWGLELVAEWTWLKLTSSGAPICNIESSRRKPWERLLIATRRGLSNNRPLRNRVLLSVPDLHSRKPNLRAEFEEFLGRGYRGLEIFARNLTSGWWAWGDQVLMFQSRKQWSFLSEFRDQVVLQALPHD